MEIQVKLFASLRRYRPGLSIGQAIQCSVPERATVGQLLNEALSLPPAEVAIVLVNGLPRDRDFALANGDSVALWPPIAGGSGGGCTV
jgi:sulfur-carrier protein